MKGQPKISRWCIFSTRNESCGPIERICFGLTRINHTSIKAHEQKRKKGRRFLPCVDVSPNQVHHQGFFSPRSSDFLTSFAFESLVHFPACSLFIEAKLFLSLLVLRAQLGDEPEEFFAGRGFLSAKSILLSRFAPLPPPLFRFLSSFNLFSSARSSLRCKAKAPLVHGLGLTHLRRMERSPFRRG